MVKLVKPMMIASALVLVAACSQKPPPPPPAPMAEPAPVPPPPMATPALPPAAPYVAPTHVTGHQARQARRHARREARHERRHARREARHERRAKRHHVTPASTSAPSRLLRVPVARARECALSRMCPRTSVEIRRFYGIVAAPDRRHGPRGGHHTGSPVELSGFMPLDLAFIRYWKSARDGLFAEMGFPLGVHLIFENLALAIARDYRLCAD